MLPIAQWIPMNTAAATTAIVIRDHGKILSLAFPPEAEHSPHTVGENRSSSSRGTAVRARRKSGIRGRRSPDPSLGCRLWLQEQVLE